MITRVLLMGVSSCLGLRCSKFPHQFAQQLIQPPPLRDSLMPMVIPLQLAKPEANDYINSRHVREMVHAQFTELSHAGLTLAFKFFQQDIITSNP